MLYGVIDLGSNTVRLSTYRIKNDKLRLSYTQKETVGLSSYIESTQILSEKGIQKAIEIVNELKEVAKKKRVNELYVIATAAIRNAVNTKDIIKRLEVETKLNVRLLSGEEEAIVGLYGIKQEYEFSDGVFVDIGGGSTEIVVYQKGTISKAFSMPIGSLNMYLKKVKKLLPSKQELKKIEYLVIDELSKIMDQVVDMPTLYGVGGTLNALKKLNIAKQEAISEVVTFKQLKRIMKMINTHEKDSYLTLIRMTPERIHTIIPGLAIIKAIFKFFNAQEMYISKFGIREGFIYQTVTNHE